MLKENVSTGYKRSLMREKKEHSTNTKSSATPAIKMPNKMKGFNFHQANKSLNDNISVGEYMIKESFGLFCQ
jgi:hypothetical protein